MTLNISSGVPIMKRSGIHKACCEIYEVEKRSNFIVDLNIGWVHRALVQQQEDFCETTILTGNSCVEYRLFLLETFPSVSLYNLPDVHRHSEPENTDKVERHRLIQKVRLTPAQREIFHNVAVGKSNKEIARLRDTTVGTIKNTLKTVYLKLDLRNRVEAAHYYFGVFRLLPTESTVGTSEAMSAPRSLHSSLYTPTFPDRTARIRDTLQERSMSDETL